LLETEELSNIEVNLALFLTFLSSAIQAAIRYLEHCVNTLQSEEEVSLPPVLPYENTVY
jgi:hypothetical protein